MENKKTFGAYIQQRRRELGMTQREFAEKLYVTESAVSKWERGLSYPDITLLRTICQVLMISEHELLTASVDTETRATEKLAEKYRRLTRNYRLAQYILYGGTLLGCAIGNLCAQHTLSWFFIVLAAVLLAASMTLLPSLLALHGVADRAIGAVSVLCAFVCLELLLGVCCIYTRGDWFFVAAAGVLLGFCVLFVPFLLPRLPLPAGLAGRKSSVCLAVDLVALLLLLLVCCVYTRGDWFFVAASGVLLGFCILFVPFLLPRLPLPAGLAGRKSSVCLAVDLVALLLLLLVCCVYTRGDWLLVTVVSVVFGLGFFLWPVFLRQLPLPQPLQRHRTLLYFAVQTLLLFALLIVTAPSWQTLVRVAVPSALLGLILPWGVMLLVRYLPANGFVRAGTACGVTAVWTWLLPWALDMILEAYYGPFDNYSDPLVQFNFANWQDPTAVSLNVFALVIFGFAALAVVFLMLGLVRARRARKL